MEQGFFVDGDFLEMASDNMSHEKKTSYFPFYWLVNRDPYFMVYYNPYITG